MALGLLLLWSPGAEGCSWTQQVSSALSCPCVSVCISVSVSLTVSLCVCMSGDERTPVPAAGVFLWPLPLLLSCTSSAFILLKNNNAEYSLRPREDAHRHDRGGRIWDQGGGTVVRQARPWTWYSFLSSSLCLCSLRDKGHRRVTQDNRIQYNAAH